MIEVGFVGSVLWACAACSFVFQKDIPLSSIFSSRDSATYGVAKEWAMILKQLVGKSTDHVNNTQDISGNIKKITLGAGECITSYDVAALFASVPVEPALEIIKERLEKKLHFNKKQYCQYKISSNY